MRREQDYLARQGYVVLHTDYRGHASSDNDKNVDYELRLSYAVDTINAVKAVKSSKLRYLDKDRVGWLGRSMGGGVTLTALVAQPGLVDAAVIYASVSSMAADNWKQFYRPSEDRARTNRRMARTYGLPDESPAFWRAASSRPYFDRVTEPLLVHHGIQDDTCPIRWSEATVKALKAADKDVTFVRYRGEGHTFAGQWQRSIERTVDFFDKHLDSEPGAKGYQATRFWKGDDSQEVNRCSRGGWSALGSLEECGRGGAVSSSGSARCRGESRGADRHRHL